MLRCWRSAVLLSLALLLAPSASRAAVAEATWLALHERVVTVRKTDGTEVTGRLIGGDEQVAVLELPAGAVVEVRKSDAASIRTSSGASAAARDGATSGDPAPAVPGAHAASSTGVTPLVQLVSLTPPRQLPRLLESDLRFERLGFEERAQLLAAFREDKRAVGSVLNFLLGYGIGSFIQGDTRGGVALLAGDVASLALLVAGVVTVVSAVEEDPFTGDLVTTHRAAENTGAALVLAGFTGFVVMRIVGVVRPLGFHGEKHRMLERRLGEGRASVGHLRVRPVVAPVARAGAVRGAQGALVVQF